MGIYDQVGHHVSGSCLSTPGPKEHIQHSWGPYPTHLLFGPTAASKAEVILTVDRRKLRHSGCRKHTWEAQPAGRVAEFLPDLSTQSFSARTKTVLWSVLNVSSSPENSSCIDNKARWADQPWSVVPACVRLLVCQSLLGS